MNFEFTEEQQTFMEDVRAFLARRVPPERQEVFGVEYDGQYQFGREIAGELAERRWLAVGWPQEHGGDGKGPIEQAIFNEQMGYGMVPRTGTTGLGFVGPALMVFGNPEQQAQYLPPIAAAQVEYCPGFSEPNVGSDLASLELRAERDGDEYVLNGSKMFTSYALNADYMYLLARTDPQAAKHRGISMFIADMKTPGISLRSLPYISGAMAAQTFFDDVRLPATALIGEENRGWYHAMTTLDFERSGLERYGRTRRAFDDFVEFCKTTRINGKTISENPSVKHKLTQTKVAFDVWSLLCWNVAWLQSTGAIPNAEASVAFLHGTEQRLKFAQSAMEILGPYATLRNESKWAPMRGTIEGIHRESMHLHGAGTSEIHRNIIAQRGLGLPR